MDLSARRNELYAAALEEITLCMGVVDKNLKGEEAAKVREDLKKTLSAYEDLQVKWTRDEAVFKKVRQEISQDPNNKNFNIRSMIKKYKKEYKDGEKPAESVCEGIASGSKETPIPDKKPKKGLKKN